MTIGVSVIVPCHDEAATIARKLGNCLAFRSVEAVEILVVDDHSTDDTARVVEDFLRAQPPHPAAWPIRLLTSQLAPGKNGALLAAFAQARGWLHLVTDADIMLAPDVLERARERFVADARLGALCLSPRVTSARRETASEFAGGYERFNRWLKIRQSRVDSLPILHGQAMFLRAGQGVAPQPTQPADDVDFAFQYRLRGLRVRYAADLHFDEELAPDRCRVFRQKRRRAVAVMRSFWHYRRVLLNPRYGLFGLMCFPIDFFLYFILAPLALAATVGVLIAATAAHGAVGLGVAAAVGVTVAVTPLRTVATYLVLLLTAQASLILEKRPRIWWSTPRSAADSSSSAH